MSHATNAATLESGKIKFQAIWEFLLIIGRTFTASEDVSIPADKTLIMTSPKMDGELKPDGEVYLL